MILLYSILKFYSVTLRAQHNIRSIITVNVHVVRRVP